MNIFFWYINIICALGNFTPVRPNQVDLIDIMEEGPRFATIVAPKAENIVPFFANFAPDFANY